MKYIFSFFSIFFFQYLFAQIDTLTNYEDTLLKSTIELDTLLTISGIDLENKTNSVLNIEKKYHSNKEIDRFINLKKEELAAIDDKEIELKLNAIETTLNIRYTPEIGKKIRLYIYNHRDFIVKMLTRAEYYFPLFEVELDKENIPLELKYLSVIESYLNPKAKSPMGATGLWQFMYATAKYKGMKITTLEDERRNPIVSTQYAAKYLKQLYSIYDDWLLAMSAYNAGAGNINKAIRNANGVKNYWVARPFMPRETQQYVPKIIALMYVMYYANDYLLFPRAPEFDYYNVSQISIPERLTLKYVSEVLSIDSTLLADLNPMLIKNFIPSKNDSFLLTIPSYAQYIYEENTQLLYDDPYLSQKDKELEEKSVSSYSYSGSGNYKTYTIRSGDNLGYIAQLFACRVSDIKRWNGMKSNFLRVGKKLRIYTNKAIPKNTASSTKNNNIKVGFTTNEIDENTCNCYKHEIVSGDNLWDIAQKYNSSIEKIKSVNNIYNNWKLKLKVFLKIPK